jgi:hypothetical protein
LVAEFAPSFEVSLGEAQLARQDIRMQIEEVIGTFFLGVRRRCAASLWRRRFA